MKLDDLQHKLTAAARLQPPDDRVPYAFEKRMMALIAARGAADRWAFWTQGLWRAAASCVAVAVVCGAASLLLPSVADNSNDLSQDFENTLLASVDQGDATP
jgi:anti-sigma-K factor RskA